MTPPSALIAMVATAVVGGAVATSAPAALAQVPAPPATGIAVPTVPQATAPDTPSPGPGDTPAPPAAAPQATMEVVPGPGTLLRSATRLAGSLPGVSPGATVEIQQLVPGRGWVSQTTATAGAGGAFAARWQPGDVGRFQLRALAGGGDSVRAAAATATTVVTVYRPARVTWYGPGLYGRRTACGQRLSRRLMGVAHKKLPCGTPIELYADGRSLTVPVVDRGPFTNGATYDLTSATAEQLAITVTSTIGVAPRRGQTMPPPLAPLPASPSVGGVSPPAASGPAAAPLTGGAVTQALPGSR